MILSILSKKLLTAIMSNSYLEPLEAAKAAIVQSLQLPPAVTDDGRFLTLNRKGPTFPLITELGEQFMEIALRPNAKVLEVGTAYGFLCLETLKRGAVTEYIANDLDERHLQILARNVQETVPERLSCLKLLPGGFPQDVREQLLTLACTIDAIMAAKVLLFFHEKHLPETFAQFYSLLKPRGRLFITLSTAYSGLVSEEYLLDFEQKVRQFDGGKGGTPPPGFVPRHVDVLRSDLSQEYLDSIAASTEHMFYFDKEIMEYFVLKAGLKIIRSEYRAAPKDSSWAYNGREALLLIAEKPDILINF